MKQEPKVTTKQVSAWVGRRNYAESRDMFMLETLADVINGDDALDELREAFEKEEL